MFSPGYQFVSLSQVLQVQNRIKLKKDQFKKFLAKHLFNIFITVSKPKYS